MTSTAKMHELPDVRDGLAPRSREVLYALQEQHATTTAYLPSARVVDAAMRRSRSVGDRPTIYAELLRLARSFELRYPLVDGQGNLGSIDNDRPADPQYTEVRLGALGREMVRGVGEDIIAFPDAPANRTAQPRALPSRLPNFLVNGSFNLTAGSPVCIPPHNLREIVDATIAYIENPDIDVEGLMSYIIGPDFPTGGTVVAGDGLRSAYETGRGKISVGARASTERAAPPHIDWYVATDRRQAASTHTTFLPNEPESGMVLVVTELPFMVSKGGRGGVLAEIRRLMKRKQIAGISSLEDHSSMREGIRIVVKPKPNVTPSTILNELVAHTRLESEYQLNLVAMVDGIVRNLTLRDAIKHYVEHRHDIVARLTGLRARDRILEMVTNDLRDIADRYGDDRRTTVLAAN